VKEELAMEIYIDKKYKADYLNYQVKFTDMLKYISVNLKNVEISSRTEVLQEKMKECNSWIDEVVRQKLANIETVCKFSYMGIILPF
jgi:hypothetical protein